MSSRILPHWINAFMSYTENTEPPRLFRRWTAISAIASAMQRKVRIDWGCSLVFYPNLYIILVGPSASGKGTAMNPGLDIISEIPTIKIAANSTSLQALIRRLKETNLTDIDMVTGEQIFHSSLTIFSKEFTVFLGYHNKELMAALCDWYDCDRRWSYETISRSKEEIIGVWVNLLGGTTPDLIQSSLPQDSIGGGLTSRIIFVVETKRDKIVSRPTITKQEVKLQESLVLDLEKISMLSGNFSWTQDFEDAWDKFCHDPRVPFTDHKFDGYIGRRRTHLMKLAMIFSVAKSDQLILTKDDFDEALSHLKEVEVNMPAVFKGFGRSDLSQLLQRAITYIKMRQLPQIPLWEFCRHFADDLDVDDAAKVLKSLETMKMIQLIKIPGGDEYIKVIE